MKKLDLKKAEFLGYIKYTVHGSCTRGSFQFYKYHNNIIIHLLHKTPSRQFTTKHLNFDKFFERFMVLSDKKRYNQFIDLESDSYELGFYRGSKIKITKRLNQEMEDKLNAYILAEQV